jgi:hypothetical protein
MNKTTISLVVSLIAIVIAIGGYFSSKPLGASGTRFPNGISADRTSPVDGEIRGTDLTITDDAVITDDATVSGGTLTVTTSNTATSTIIGGCFQTYATSTQTPWRGYASSTATIEGVDGVYLMQYGTCPI